MLNGTIQCREILAVLSHGIEGLCMKNRCVYEVAVKGLLIRTG
jgi:hypothetical protein